MKKKKKMTKRSKKAQWSKEREKEYIKNCTCQ